MRLIHLTDPHLSDPAVSSVWHLRGKRRLGYLSWTRRRQFIHKPEILERVMEAIAREAPDVIAVTGDLVQIAGPGEIAQASDWLGRLRALGRVVLVPGNHDLYQADAESAVTRQWAEYFGVPAFAPNAFPSLQRFGDVSVIGLSSAEPQPFWSAGGRLGSAQLARFEQVLAATADTLRCVLIHHPPLAKSCARRKALRDVTKLEEVLKRFGVEIVLHGHTHRNREVSFNNVTRVAGTASASNCGPDGRASYRVLDFGVGDSSSEWRVTAKLKVLSSQGHETRIEADESWHFLRPQNS
jgi:3',5'-cyclic AMP phosphodiesterase CpdA